jgi:hypothetical protein
MEYESLAGLIEPYADGPFSDLPGGLHERVTEAFFPMGHWDVLMPNQRRSLASQHDGQHDPKMERENEYFLALVCRLQETESKKLEWELMAPRSIADLGDKEEKLRALNAQLDALKKKLDAPYPEIPSAAPEVAVGTSSDVAIASSKRWTPELLAELKAYRYKHGTKQAAAHYGISASLVRQKLPGEKPKTKGYSAFTHRI